MTHLKTLHLYEGKTIVSIGENAFQNNSVESILLPNTVKTIEDKAFYNLTSLKTIIANGVETVGRYAFMYCIDHLATFILPLTAQLYFLGFTFVSLQKPLKNLSTKTYLLYVPHPVKEFLISWL